MFPIDFVAFWCAGNATLHGANPYLEGSLHVCERSYGLLPSLTVPVPYPPYDMALFAAAATLPEPLAFALYCILVLAVTVVAGFAMGRVAGIGFFVATAAFALALAIPSLPFGQVAPFAVCGLVCALLAVRNDRPVLAALGLAAAAIVPNLALPAWIASFIAAPRTRVPLMLCGLALMAIALLVAGPNVCLQYVAGVLPAHARSEMVGWGQLGSISLFYALLRAPQIAFALAYAVFAAFVAGGIVVGSRLARRFGGAHWTIASAAAFGAIGSPFLHGHDVAFAAPLALMLAVAAGGLLAQWSAILILTPWQTLIYSGGVAAAASYPLLFVVTDRLLRLRPIVTGAFLVLVAALTIPVIGLEAREPTPAAVARQLNVAASPSALAEERWTALNQRIGVSPIAWYERGLIDAGFAVLAIAAIASAYPDR